MGFRPIHLPVVWAVRQYFEDRRHWVHYLDLVFRDHMHDWEKYVDIPLEQNVIQALNEHLSAYLEKGVEPPAAIRTTVVNLADDLVAGREPMIRTGDYIAMQSFVRSRAK